MRGIDPPGFGFLSECDTTWVTQGETTGCLHTRHLVRPDVAQVEGRVLCCSVMHRRFCGAWPKPKEECFILKSHRKGREIVSSSSEGPHEP